MASHAPKPPTAGMAFVTLTTHARRPIFEISRVAELFISTLLHYRVQGHYKLPHAMSLAHAVNLIQAGFVHRIETTIAIWEPSYTAYSIRSMRDLDTVRSYLYQVPVRAQLTPSAELYPYSSAYRNRQPATNNLPTVPSARSPSERLHPARH
jgi:putative transposase